MKIAANAASWRARTTDYAIAALCLIALGCSDDDQPSGSERIPIGFIATDIAGANSQQRAEQLLIVLRDINDAGGIELEDGRHELDLVVVDHQGTVEGVVDAMESLAADGVTATVGPPWSSLTLGENGDGSDGAVGAAKKLDMLLISASATAPAIRDLDDDDLMWRTAPSDNVHGTIAANYMLDNDISTAAVLFRDDVWGNGLSGVFAENFEQGGGSVVAQTKLPTDADEDTDYSDLLDEVFADQPDAIYILAFEEAFAIALQIDSGGYLDAYGDEPPLFFGADGFYGEDLVANAPASFLSRVVGTVGGADESTESYSALRELMADNGYDENADLETSRVDAIALIALAIQATQSTDAQRLKKVLGEISRAEEGDELINFGDWSKARKALVAGDSITYAGATGSIEFDSKGDRTQGVVLLWQVKQESDGDFVLDQSKFVPFDLTP